jgi:hypothetical protein
VGKTTTAINIAAGLQVGAIGAVVDVDLCNTTAAWGSSRQQHPLLAGKPLDKPWWRPRSPGSACFRSTNLADADALSASIASGPRQPNS